MTDYARVYMCSLDFIRAMNERPLILKLLCRVFFGKYAYREFMFMVNSIREDGYAPFGDYMLQDADYHDDPQPLMWWTEE